MRGEVFKVLEGCKGGREWVRQVGVEVVAIPGKVEGGFGCVREVEVVVVLGGV